MSKDCCVVVFSNRAYNTIIRETFDKHPVETGGILLGHIVDGVWVVMEVLPPGINSIFQYAYFEYDQEFVNYLAQSVANQYEIPLQLLGLWHRHPSSMDVFSATDDETNSTFASLSPSGTISGLVNVDPSFRLTMYHLEHDCGINSSHRPLYEKIEIEVGDDIIPKEFFQLKFYSPEKNNLHPIPTPDIPQKHSSITTFSEDDVSNLEEPVHVPFNKKMLKWLEHNKKRIVWTTSFVAVFSCGCYVGNHFSGWKQGISEYVKEKVEHIKNAIYSEKNCNEL